MSEFKEQKNFDRITLIPKDDFDPESFRTKPIYQGRGKNKIDTGKRNVYACPVGSWDRKKRACRVPMQIHAVLIPKPDTEKNPDEFEQEKKEHAAMIKKVISQTRAGHAPEVDEVVQEIIDAHHKPSFRKKLRIKIQIREKDIDKYYGDSASEYLDEPDRSGLNVLSLERSKKGHIMDFVVDGYFKDVTRQAINFAEGFDPVDYEISDVDDKKIKKVRNPELDPRLVKGTRVYFKGDQANMATYGTIIEEIPADRFSSGQVRIKWDNERFEGDTKKESVLEKYYFTPDRTGTRFYIAEDYQRQRRAAMKQLLKHQTSAEMLVIKEQLKRKKNPDAAGTGVNSKDGKIYLSEVATLDTVEIMSIVDSERRVIKVMGEEEPRPSKFTKNKVYLCQDMKTILIYPMNLKKLMDIVGKKDKQSFRKIYNLTYALDRSSGEKRAIENYEEFIHRRPTEIESKKMDIDIAGPYMFIGLANRLIYRTSKENDVVKRHDHKYESVAGVLVNDKMNAMLITQNEIGSEGIKT